MDRSICFARRRDPGPPRPRADFLHRPGIDNPDWFSICSLSGSIAAQSNPFGSDLRGAQQHHRSPAQAGVHGSGTVDQWLPGFPQGTNPSAQGPREAGYGAAPAAGPRRAQGAFRDRFVRGGITLTSSPRRKPGPIVQAHEPRINGSRPSPGWKWQYYPLLPFR